MKMKTSPPLILGSGSPRRAEILKLIGFDFKVITRPIDEEEKNFLDCTQLASSIAEKKALCFSDLWNENIILTADTVVCLDNQSLAKPEDIEEAIFMLRQLSGKQHEVITGVCLAWKGEIHTFSECTNVYFKQLSDAEIGHYVVNFKPFDKAGGYGIQEWLGLIGIEKIEGDYYNVMGFPAFRFWKEYESLAKNKGWYDTLISKY